jgi:hypothetical protein
MVRSKSELVIANMLFRMKDPLAQYEYERPLDGTAAPGRMRPDFSFVDPAGELIVWEHLGMLGREDYRRAWQWKKDWYKKNGFKVNENLFATEDDERGGLDCAVVTKTAEMIKALL